MIVFERIARFILLIFFLANQIPFLIVEPGDNHSSECCCFEGGSCNHPGEDAVCHALELTTKSRICSFAPNQDTASKPYVIVHFKYFLYPAHNLAQSKSEKEIDYTDLTKTYKDLILPIPDKPPEYLSSS